MAEMFEITDFKPKIKNQVIKIKQQDLRLQCPFKLTVSGKRFTFYIMLLAHPCNHNASNVFLADSSTRVR